MFRDTCSPGLALSFVCPMAWTWELLSVFRDTSSPGLALPCLVVEEVLDMLFFLGAELQQCGDGFGELESFFCMTAHEPYHHVLQILEVNIRCNGYTYRR